MPTTSTRFQGTGRILHAALLAFVTLMIFGFCFVLVGPWLGVGRAEAFSGSLRVFIGLAIHVALCLGVVIWLGLLRFGRTTMQAVGWRFDRPWPALALGFAGGALCILWWGTVVVAFGMYRPDAIVQRILAYSVPQRLQFLVLGLEAALLEETLFRGYLQHALVERMGLPAGIAVTAASFVLYNFQILRNPVGLVVGIGTALLLGALRGRDRSLLTPGIAHFLIWQVLGSM
jgi:membrane protease YdiL (CAAX protease family)